MTQPTPLNLHSHEHIQGSRYYLFSINLDRCMGSCNTLNDLSNRVCVPNKTEDLNLHVLHITNGINKSKLLTKHITCEC